MDFLISAFLPAIAPGGKRKICKNLYISLARRVACHFFHTVIFRQEKKEDERF
jgi:hypothetical protein